jgi:predicted anti-sigma-YlaC factor YlaD
MTDFYNCEQCVDLLMDYLEETLDDHTLLRLEDHLKACAPCVNFFQTYRKSTEMTHRLLEQQVDVPREVQDRLKSFLREELTSLGTDRE